MSRIIHDHGHHRRMLKVLGVTRRSYRLTSVVIVGAYLLLMMAISAGAQTTITAGAQTTITAESYTGVTSPTAAIVRVRIDSARHEALITIGPLRIPAATSYTHHFAQLPAPFMWPATGWVRGFRIELLDSAGRTLPRELLHHAGVTNLDRRQLAYPTAERLFAAGRETEPVTLPASYGIPVSQSQRMLLYYAFANASSRALNGVTLRITMPWQAIGDGRPRTVMPMYFDAHPVLGGASTFDVPSGRSSTSAEFVLPASGHLRYLGGHLHDFGVELRLEDAEANTVLARLRADRASDGQVRDVDRTRFFFTRKGLRMSAGHRYRVVAVYDNPKCAPISGAMGLLVAVFAPDNVAGWPAVDTSDARYQKDLAWLLDSEGAGGTEAHHHGPDAVASHHSSTAVSTCHG